MKRFAAILLSLFFGVNGEIRLSLDGNGPNGPWKVWNQNKSKFGLVVPGQAMLACIPVWKCENYVISHLMPDESYIFIVCVQIPGIVPGGIYTDLQRAGILSKNLFYRFNDIEYRWVAKDNWTYQRTFDLPSEMLTKTAVNLVFHGIDTVGEIYLNDVHLMDVQNMFVRYVLPIKKVAKEKGNVLQVRLKSPIHEAKRLAEIQNKKYKVPPSCPPDVQNGECHRNFLRKMQASFSWDWGPAFPSVGIWKSVEVEAFDLGVIRDITATACQVNETLWQINTTTHVEYADEAGPNARSPRLSGQLSLRDITRNEVTVNAVPGESYRDAPTVRNGYVSHLRFYVDPRLFELWWPNGYGRQPLYDITVSLHSADDLECSTKKIKIGFRTVEVVQEQIDPKTEGLTFYFKVNGVPIFAKGSNWIPGHVLPELGYDKDMITHALTSAKDTHMNMLRVWGGGVYESDFFYSLADELGILIWQDMMFAVSLYPTDDNFLDNVKVETEQQIRRLQHHPSIAIWAGNNENEEGLASDWFNTRSNFTLYKKDYVKLYVDTIRPVVNVNDDSRYYAISSPSNGLKTVQEKFVSVNPQSGLYGDVHFYGFLGDPWIPAFYPTTRFTSEYGFQSMPSFQTMAEVSLPEDRKMHSGFSTKRQHAIAGTSVMTAFVRKNLPLPEDNESEEYYKTFIYFSQINQAVAVKTETEKYRRDRSRLDKKNLGLTMGALYWQLNDVWQAPTWSSIEFGGRWKMLQYYAKKFFSPVLISPELTADGNVDVYLVSDLLEDVPNVNLNVFVYAWNDMNPRKTMSYTVLMKKASSERHKSYALDDLLKSAKCKKEECFLYFTARGPKFFTENELFLKPFFEVKNIQPPNMSVKLSKTQKPNEIAVHITTDKIAPFVWLETDVKGEFSDNGFLLLKREVDLTFRDRFNKAIDVEKMRTTLKTVSLVPKDIGEIKRQLLLGRVIAEGLAEFAKEGVKKVLQ